tara:strand:+ start:1127 stop:1411 length:285 start_codon:yes stop_codon:yes gene_type:complete
MMHIRQNAITGEITEVPLTEEEIAHGALERIKSRREERNRILLAEVDPIVSNALRWNDMTDAKRTEWTNYRQALLDVPAQDGYPDNITWPTKPS